MPAKKAVKKAADKPKAKAKAAPVDVGTADVVQEFEAASADLALEKREKKTACSYWLEHNGRNHRIMTIYPKPKSVRMHTPLDGIKVDGKGFSGAVGSKYIYMGGDAKLISTFIKQTVSSAKALAKTKPEPKAEKATKKPAKKAAKKPVKKAVMKAVKK